MVINMNRNYVFSLVNLAIFIDTILYGIIVPIVPHYSVQLGITTSQIGWIFAAYALALLLASIPLGRAVDIYGYKPVLTLGMVGLTLATAAFSLSHSLPLLLLGRILQGVAAAATWSAGLALVAAIFPSEVKGQKMGLVMTATGLGTIVGPVLGGFLYQAAGYSAPFLLIIMIGTVLSLLFLKSSLPGKSPTNASTSPGLSSLFKRRNVFWGMLISVIGSFTISILEPLLPIYFDQRFSLNSAGIGLLFGLLSLTFALSQPLFGSLSDRLGRKPLIVAGLLGTAIVMPGLALAPSLKLVIVVMSLLGVTSGIYSATNLPLLAESVENKLTSTAVDPAPSENDDYISRVESPANNSPYGAAFGFFNTAYSLGLVAGPLVGTSLVQLMGLKMLLLASSLLLSAIALGGGLRIQETLST